MRFAADTLMLFPCCARKKSGGSSWNGSTPSIAGEIANDTHKRLLTAQNELLTTVKTKTSFTSGEYAKNKDIASGPDFGGETVGRYMPAVDRYTGTLYTADKNLAAHIRKACHDPNGPRLLIVSALYGLLHPLELIQDYNLQMSDSPAKSIWTRNLPGILKDYIERNAIKRVVMYFGGSTPYLTIARNTVEPLYEKGTIEQMLRYDIKGGSTYHTPHNHGLLLSQDLTRQNPGGFTKQYSLI